MAARPEDQQIEHDLVIEALIEQYSNSAKYNLFANPGTEQNVAVGHQYPDVVVTERGSSKVRYVIEVETTDTIGDQELSHWRALAALGPPLYLMSPYAALADAGRLCSEAGLKCHHGYFIRDDKGRLKVILKKATAPTPNAGHH
ncbi:MAG TPA: hypothetical protein VMH22_01455 [bacterium]|nr:hypothetical protein [bacterium]